MNSNKMLKKYDKILSNVADALEAFNHNRMIPKNTSIIMGEHFIEVKTNKYQYIRFDNGSYIINK